MRDRNAMIAHWLASGRTADLVAPAVRAATGPRSRETMSAARSMMDTARQMDPHAIRMAGDRLARDPELRKAALAAAAAVRKAVDDSTRRRHRGRRWFRRIMLVGAGAAVAAAAARALGGGGPDARFAPHEASEQAHDEVRR